MAAVLACGPGACASHLTAASTFGIIRDSGHVLHISVPRDTHPRRAGLRTHRRRMSESEVTTFDGIPITKPARTLVDIATMIRGGELEAAINEADKRDLITPEELRERLDAMGSQRGVARVRRALDDRTFTLTDSELERRFIPIGLKAAGSRPVTGAVVNCFKVDFWWPDLGLVVETDGLRYHRTPAQQYRDRLRDQAHVVAGLTPLRFTHAQVYYEPGHVEKILAAVARRLRALRIEAPDT